MRTMSLVHCKRRVKSNHTVRENAIQSETHSKMSWFSRTYSWDGTYSNIGMTDAVNWGKNERYSFILDGRLYDHIRIWTEHEEKLTMEMGNYCVSRNRGDVNRSETERVVIRFSWTHDCVCVFHSSLSSSFPQVLQLTPILCLRIILLKQTLLKACW